MDVLNLEEERGRLNELILLDLRAGDPEAAAHVRNNIAIQSRLVSALEQLEQAREALELVRSIIADGALTGFNCHSGDWAERLFKSQAVTFTALKQHEVG